MGAQADYPVTLGAPFLVDGTLYTPNDTINYDEIGYATLDLSSGATVSIAHRTLPIPSYVELTALDSGRTILARVERRGPMQGPYIAGLSRGAATQLRAEEGTPIRARRVLPPESERAQLRNGAPASARADMPLSLVNVLAAQASAQRVRRYRHAGKYGAASFHPDDPHHRGDGRGCNTLFRQGVWWYAHCRHTLSACAPERRRGTHHTAGSGNCCDAATARGAR